MMSTLVSLPTMSTMLMITSKLLTMFQQKIGLVDIGVDKQTRNFS